MYEILGKLSINPHQHQERGKKKNPTKTTWIYQGISILPILFMKHLFSIRCSEQPQTLRAPNHGRELLALEQLFGEKKRRMHRAIGTEGARVLGRGRESWRGFLQIRVSLSVPR